MTSARMQHCYSSLRTTPWLQLQSCFTSCLRHFCSSSLSRMWNVHASYLFMQHTSILFSETIWNSNVWYSMVFELSCSPTGSNEHQKLNLIMEHRYDPSGSYWMIMLSCFASILIAFHCGIFWADWSDFFSRLYSIVWVEFGYKPLVSYTGSRAGQWVHDR